ncbi:hypothetical protein CNR22_11935 [Sphingobacteriaceae bacterium]|nr:hypothetical protein CNR22_11935 [Sphingobacteriaceae bacterium]
MSNSKNCSENLPGIFRPGISMPQKLSLILVSLSFALLYSCGPSREEKEYLEKSAAISGSVKAYRAGLATDTIQGITHNFARTADIRFRVKSVLDASDRIEDLVKGCGGYISLSNLSSQINYSSSVKFKEDSLAEITHYTTVNTITLRVPNKELDSVVRCISKLAVFIDSRRLTADDLKLSLYANSLSEKRYHTYESKVANKIQKSKNDLKQELKGEEEVLKVQTLADNTMLDSYVLSDKINYATLSLDLYQTEQVSILKRAIESTPVLFEPSFLSQLKSAFISGFELLQNLVLFLIRSWGLWIVLIIVFILFKKIMPWLRQSLSAK